MVTVRIRTKKRRNGGAGKEWYRPDQMESGTMAAVGAVLGLGSGTGLCPGRQKTHSADRGLPVGGDDAASDEGVCGRPSRTSKSYVKVQVTVKGIGRAAEGGTSADRHSYQSTLRRYPTTPPKFPPSQMPPKFEDYGTRIKLADLPKNYLTSVDLSRRATN